MFRVSFLSLIILISASGITFAGQPDITKEMVDRKYTELENVLNNRSDYIKAVKFLHEHISEDARFRLTVTSPTVDHSGKGPAMEMNKQDYINTYIQGARFVKNYEMNIQTAGFQYDPEKQQAYTVDVMTERGTVPSLNSTKPFISRTTCQTRHELKGETVVATASQCHTDVSFEEEI